MAIKVRKQISEEKAFEKNLKVAELVDGDFIVECVGSRFVPESAQYEDAFYIDLRIKETPAGAEQFVGKLTAWGMMKKRYRDFKTKTGGTFTAKQQEDKDEEKVQISLAAVLGFERADAGNVDQETMDAAFQVGRGQESPAVGRSAIFRVKSYIKDGELKRFGELLPLKVGGVAAALSTATKVAAVKAPPPPPKAKVSFEEAAKLAGFEPRSDFPGWFYNEQTEEQLDTDDLKAKLGF